ncbi:MAG: S8 family serine peptidase [Ideonella sp.]|nr:S8 family serine peptidase [Ideonella sp.]
MSISEGSTDIGGSTATIGWINVSGSVYGFIDPSSDTDWYVTYLLAGTAYKIQMASPTMDSYLVLRNSAGTQLVYADAAGPGGVETINLTPQVSGVYYIDAESYRASAANTGFYEVWLTSNRIDDFTAGPDTSSVLALGTAKSGNLESAADADWHKISLSAGQTYSFALTGAVSDAEVKVFDSLGLETEAFGSGYCEYLPTTSGTYFVEVSGLRLQDVGAYALTAWKTPALTSNSPSVLEGDSGTKNLVFTLSLSAKSPVDVQVQVDTVDQTAVAGTDYQAVHLNVTIPAGKLSATVNVPVLGNTYFEPARGFELALSNLKNVTASESPLGIIIDDDLPAELVASMPKDELIGFEWYLYTIRAPFAWQLATGKGVKIGIFDQGIDSLNSDLTANTNLSLGRATYTLTTGGAPQTASDNHGTWVAGVIGAANDGKGVVGVSYNAQLVSLYTSDAITKQYFVEIANAFKYAKSLDILNNSWGFGNLLQSDTNWAFLDDARDPAFAPAFAALADLAATGRHGLGTIVVQSAGNSYSYGDDTNLHNFQNSRYIVTVGSTDYFGQISSFSTQGASILVSAPGGGGNSDLNSILTTDRVGASGGAAGEFDYVDGTSFSAPVVSGVVALMLEANPRLGYRDVQQILAYSAKQVDVGVGKWETNGAFDWNGGGLHFNAYSHATGFGQVDALAAVRLAASWDDQAHMVSNTKEIVLSKSVKAAIPDNDVNGVFSSINVSEDMNVERVDVTVNVTHPFVGDLQILLLSPAGTTSFLLWRPAQGALSAYGSSQHDIHFTFDSVLNWGESSVGSWGLYISDADQGATGTFNDWTLDLIGSPYSRDNTYVYTNEYPTVVATDPSRAVLSDPDGGRNVLNAGALGLDNRLDLSGRSLSVLNGANLKIAAGTIIAEGIGGDGADTLIANDLGSLLRGMGGSDVLKGGPGPDRLEGGVGSDHLDGAGGIDFAVFTGSRGSYGLSKHGSEFWVQDSAGDVDQLSTVERLSFSDRLLAIDLDGHAGSTAKLLGALFGKQYLSNKEIVGIGLGLLDSGLSYADLVGLATRTDLFAQLAGSHGNTDFVKLVYKNVVGVAPTAGDLNYFVGLLNDGTFTQATLGMLACETDANKLHVDLVGLAATGIEYLPYVVG